MPPFGIHRKENDIKANKIPNLRNTQGKRKHMNIYKTLEKCMKAYKTLNYDVVFLKAVRCMEMISWSNKIVPNNHHGDRFILFQYL